MLQCNFICTRYKNDLWLWDFDWSVQDVRIKKPKPPKKGRKKKQQEDEMKDDQKVSSFYACFLLSIQFSFNLSLFALKTFSFVYLV